jgi:HSP20 family protein
MGIMDKVASLVSRRASPERVDTARVDTPRMDLANLEDELDRWLRQLLNAPAVAPGTGGISPATLHESDGELTVTMEIPGFGRDEIELLVTAGALTVRGEKREERSGKGRGARVSEVRYGRFTRRIPLPPGVDAKRARAQLTNGVLTVRVPKTTDSDSARRRIQLAP